MNHTQEILSMSPRCGGQRAWGLHCDWQIPWFHLDFIFRLEWPLPNYMPFDEITLIEFCVHLCISVFRHSLSLIAGYLIVGNSAVVATPRGGTIMIYSVADTWVKYDTILQIGLKIFFFFLGGSIFDEKGCFTHWLLGSNTNELDP